MLNEAHSIHSPSIFSRDLLQSCLAEGFDSRVGQNAVYEIRLASLSPTVVLNYHRQMVKHRLIRHTRLHRMTTHQLVVHRTSRPGRMKRKTCQQISHFLEQTQSVISTYSNNFRTSIMGWTTRCLQHEAHWLKRCHSKVSYLDIIFII